MMARTNPPHPEERSSERVSKDAECQSEMTSRSSKASDSYLNRLCANGWRDSKTEIFVANIIAFGYDKHP